MAEKGTLGGTKLRKSLIEFRGLWHSRVPFRIPTTKSSMQIAKHFKLDAHRTFEAKVGYLCNTICILSHWRHIWSQLAE